MVTCRNRSAVWAPTLSATSAKVIGSSCSPTGALVDGVKIGSGRMDASTSPRGSSTPETFPVLSYSFRPPPVRKPRATHSTGTISSRRHRIARPANSGGTSVAEITWLGTRSASCSNHHSDSAVSSLPLSGIGVGRTTS